MATYGLPILFTLVLWWVSTVVILYLDGLHRRTFIWSLTGASFLMAVSLWGAQATSGDTSVNGVYCAFACGLTAWGWQITTFYMGAITGPRKTACEPDCRGFEKFVQAARTCAHHEVAIIVMAAGIMWLTWKQPNQFGFWTFIVLWWMHTSAKLNVFFGVPNLGAELVPHHMRYLVSFMAKRPMNLFFPLSVTASTICAVHLTGKAMAPGASQFEATGYAMLATLMVLAILEHWFLVTPLDTNALWKWGVKPDHEEGASSRLVSSASHARDEMEAGDSDYPRPGGGESATMDTWSAAPPTICDDAILTRLLDAIRAGAFGDIKSVKGVVKTRADWVQFEVDSHRAKIAPFAPRQKVDPLVIALGRRMDRVRLQAAFDACAAAG
jgi:putative photosynthetic complex assembly protein 2